MEDAPLQTTQSNLSRTLVNRYVDRLLIGGSEAPSIKVVGDIVVDGNHRYIADLLARRQGYNGPALKRVPGVLPRNPGLAVPWDQVNWYD